MVVEEAGGALALGVRLPDPHLWLADGTPDETVRAVDDWQRSWDLPLPEARRLRAAAYPLLAKGLVGGLSVDGMAIETAALGEGVRRAEVLNLVGLPPHVALGLAEARARQQDAEQALQQGRTEALLEALVRGGDALREVGPEAVARDLVFEAESRLGRITADDPYSKQDLERLRRLIVGGRQALDDRDWVLAIRRAYYAVGVLDGKSQGASW